MEESDPTAGAEEEEEEDGPGPPPRAFGLPAHPAGCGLLGGALFALAVAPVVLAYAAPNNCSPYDGNCRWPPEGTGLALALIAWAAAAFAAATAALVGRRLALWRAGRRVRPALWVAFVALIALAWGPGSTALALLLLAMSALAG